MCIMTLQEGTPRLLIYNKAPLIMFNYSNDDDVFEI